MRTESITLLVTNEMLGIELDIEVEVDHSEHDLEIHEVRYDGIEIPLTEELEEHLIEMLQEKYAALREDAAERRAEDLYDQRLGMPI